MGLINLDMSGMPLKPNPEPFRPAMPCLQDIREISIAIGWKACVEKPGPEKGSAG